MLLKDKVVIVTGVGPGMGRKLAVEAAKEGAKVAISARSQGFLDEVLHEIKLAGGEAIAVKTDVAESEQCEALAQRTLDAFGRIDGLVNSAYKLATFTSFEEDAIEAWAANYNVTCLGALRMTKAVMPTMKKQKSGAIVNITALAAVQPAVGQFDYAAAKAALESATRSLAKELGTYNVRINCTRMGWLWGAPLQGYFSGQAQATGQPEQQFVDQVANRIALGVIPPDEECARTALLFVSDYTRMVTGTTLNVNGGEFFM